MKNDSIKGLLGIAGRLFAEGSVEHAYAVFEVLQGEFGIAADPSLAQSFRALSEKLVPSDGGYGQLGEQGEADRFINLLHERRYDTSEPEHGY
jgi:hypothetical protein